MTETKFTLGPWKVGDCDSSVIWARCWRSVPAIECPDTPAEGISVGYASNPGWASLDAARFSAEEREAWQAESAANARLIAAAPEMFEALTECEEYFDNRADADCEGDPLEFVPNKEMRLLSVVRDALSKALGKEG